MHKEAQKAIISQYTEDRHKLITSKQEDYAQEADVLSNFRYVAIAGGRKMSNVILDEVHKKVLRLQNLLQGKTPNNESVLDSVKDLSNYADLMVCAMSEEQAPEKLSVMQGFFKQVKQLSETERLEMATALRDRLRKNHIQRNLYTDLGETRFYLNESGCSYTKFKSDLLEINTTVHGDITSVIGADDELIRLYKLA